MRQSAHQAHRIDEHHRAPVRQRQGTRRGVKRCKQLILCQHARMGQRVHQRGFSGIGIANDRHCLHSVFIAPLPQADAPAFHNLELLFQRVDTAVDMAAVAFQLAFTRAARTDAATQTGELRPLSTQTWKGVFELRELHLQLTLA